MKPFTPRKKKLHKPKVTGKMRSVRIDAKTIICVDASLSDEEARERFLSRYRCGCYGPERYMPPKIKSDMEKERSREVGMGTLEELESIIDETMKPDPD